MNDFTDYGKIIEEFITLFDNLIPIEQEKLDAAVKNQVTFIEDCMHREQAAVLQLRGLKQSRGVLGWKDIASARSWNMFLQRRTHSYVLCLTSYLTGSVASSL